MKKLKHLRRDSGLTQQELASACGVARWRIAHAEVGLARLTAEEMKAVRCALVEACERRSARVLRSLGQEAVAKIEAVA
jgi:predicted transcriptional regulator